MTMTLPLSPASGNSSSSDAESPLTPSTPNSQQETTQQQNNQSANPSSPTNNASQVKRKPSRRANTAERRATHNAVERQRRETLNGRFLDLAALLPNLSQIRRPSKSSIVNSSIAHIHASRRHRFVAARELRMLKHEADALRREINDWRDRSGLPRIEEPVRSESFTMVLSGELEVVAAVPGEEDGEDDNDYAGYEDDFPNVIPNHGVTRVHSHHANSLPPMDEMDDPRVTSMMKTGHSFAHNIPSGPAGNGLPLAHILPRPPVGATMVPSPASFEGANMYDAPHGFGGSPAGPGFMQQPQQSMEAEKMAAWYGAQSPQQMMAQQRSLYTPPTPSHGLSGSNGNNGNGSNGSVSPVNGNPASNGGSKPASPASNPFSDPSQAFFAANMSRQQGYSNEEGSAASNGPNGKRLSVPVPIPINVAGRARALSTASHSVGMSSPGSSPVSAGSPTYEVDNQSFARRSAPNGWRDEIPISQQHGHGLMGIMSSGMMMNGMGMGMNNGLIGNAMGTMVPVGGGGNGGAFGMMM